MSSNYSEFIQDDPDRQAVRVCVYVQPGAKVPGIAGQFDGCLKIKIAAPPLDGAANRAAAHFLAEILGIPLSNIELIRGQTSRRKVFGIRGLTANQIQLKLLG